jgi:endonuclease/exonuclease/phosphatase family metal-dependent hydrolase
MKKVVFILFSIGSVLLVLLYVSSCLTPYINPASFWPMTFLGLAFPLLAVAVLCCIISWVFINRRIALALTLIFLAGYKNIRAVFAFRLPEKFEIAKDSSTLRILNWNVRHFKDSKKLVESSSERRGIIDYMHKVNADIILIQEFLEIKQPGYYSNIGTLRDSLGYKYYYTSADMIMPRNSSEFGCAIFSKFPIENVQRRQFINLVSPESVSTVDVTFAGKKIRVATTHLVSLDLGAPPNDAEFFGRVDTDFILHSSQLQKLIRYDGVHGGQAIFVKNILDQSPYPVIVSGDFNSVAGSYAYHKIKGNLQDAFVEKGSGIGRTYTGLFPTLRIDFIFADKQFEVLQFTSPALYLSDHFPVVTDLKWREN